MSASPRYFIGTFEHTLDAVNRFVIPARWRTGASEELAVFAREEGRLSVLPRSEVEKTLQQIQASEGISLKEKRDKRFRIFSAAEEVTCDQQGRITLSAKSIRHAGLKNSIVLVGGGERFEIWNSKAWRQRETEQGPALSATLDEFGI